MNQQLSHQVVLAKAVLRAANILGLSEQRLKKVLKIYHSSTIAELDPMSEAGQRALILIRIFQCLYSLSGSEERVIKKFMLNNNNLTKGIPIEQIEQESGLIEVLEYIQSLSKQDFC